MGQPHTSRPREPGNHGYRAPVGPGQQYPPLGYDEHGRPQYTYRSPSEVAAPAAEPARPAAAASPQVPPPPPPRRSETIGIVVAISAVVVVVALGLLVLWPGDDGSEIAEPPRPPATFDQPAITPGTTAPRVPRSRTPDSAPRGPAVDVVGKEVVYTVETDGRASIVFIDGEAVRVASAEGRTWTVSFTGTAMPVRVTVVVAAGTEASCRIEVDGDVVASDAVDGTDSSGMLSCVA